MNDKKSIGLVKLFVLLGFIGLPILLMFQDAALGGFFLISGLYATHRAFRYIGNRHLRYDETNQRHNTNASGKTIFVQVVDDFGRELPPGEVERRMAEARAKADPRDIIKEVNFKVEDQ